jgi:uncharacterized membrane protein SirB2
MYSLLHSIHVAFAVITISGFMLRGYWLFADSAWLGKRVTRVAPHVIDALFLASGIAIVLELRLDVLANGWLLAKFAGLLAYILLGMVVMRFGRTREIRLLAFVGALASYAFVVGAAITKSPASWLAQMTS